VIDAREIAWAAPLIAFVLALLCTVALRDDAPTRAVRDTAAQAAVVAVAHPATPRLRDVPALPEPLARPRPPRRSTPSVAAPPAQAPIPTATVAPAPVPPAPAPVVTPRPTPAPTFDDSGSGPAFDEDGSGGP
jgi:hypothetical protein